jgi:hypothetical protein
VTAGGTLTVHSKCLDVTGSGTTSGTLIDLRTCDGSAGQQWRLIPNGIGATVTNPQSGLCLTDPADARADGTQLQIQACSAADPGQSWRVS